MKRIAIIWINFGPYHVARTRALTSDFDVVGIELAGFQRIYGWKTERVGTAICTLRQGAWEDQSQWVVLKDLWNRLRSLRPQILLIPGYASAVALGAAFWGRLSGARTILMSESTADDHPRRWRAELLKKFLVKTLFDSAIVGGRRSAGYLSQLGMRESRIFFGYDVVDNRFFSDQVDLYRRQAQETKLATTPGFFLYVGRIAPEKNLVGLVRAFAEYRRQGGIWSMVLVGDGPLKESIRAEIDTQAVGSVVTFAGRKDASELVPYYAEASCFVLPSKREPWGLVVNEAMASGLPVIVSTRCGCADDLVEHGQNGYLFDPDSDSSLVEVLWRMEHLDPTVRTCMGMHSRKLIQAYSVERWATAVKSAAAADYAGLL